jgi:hypothetical protein
MGTTTGGRHRGLILAIGVGFIAVWYGILMGAYVFAPALKNAIRLRATELLRAEFGTNVSFQSFDVSFLPRVQVIARGVLIGNNATHPLIRATSAIARSDLLPWHVRTVVLQGLSVRIPTTRVPTVRTPLPRWTISIGEIVAEHAQVEIVPSAGDDTPLHLELGQLRIKNFVPTRSADFSATIVSSEPRAEVQANGRLGPWNPQDPSLTPLQGTYTMPHGDLAAWPGLRGVLSSQGRFQGALRRLEIAGDANAAQVSLSLSGRPEPLRARFQAVVDAADGSAIIEQLNGAVQSSAFVANGVVHNIQDDRLRDIELDVSVSQGRLEDIVPLAVKSKTSPISGPLRMQGKLQILPGQQDFLNRIRLEAGFAAPDTRFASLDLRERLRDASRKAQGHPKDAAVGSSRAGIQGQVQLNDGVAQFSILNFDLEGASARLKGSYQLSGERLNLHGELWMAAKLSQTAAGAKAFFLKAAQPFFRSKRAGSRVPIQITGTRSDPHFSLDLASKKSAAGWHAHRVLFSH